MDETNYKEIALQIEGAEETSMEFLRDGDNVAIPAPEGFIVGTIRHNDGWWSINNVAINSDQHDYPELTWVVKLPRYEDNLVSIPITDIGVKDIGLEIEFFIKDVASITSAQALVGDVILTTVEGIGEEGSIFIPYGKIAFNEDAQIKIDRRDEE